LEGRGGRERVRGRKESTALAEVKKGVKDDEDHKWGGRDGENLGSSHEKK